ncbi:MAG: PDZ domain-containing protein [Candidatus Rokubacteria bacterium]|nr:PDZ domain-containing protein [Candidatus Rokubacteria bacterium]
MRRPTRVLGFLVANGLLATCAAPERAPVPPPVASPPAPVAAPVAAVRAVGDPERWTGLVLQPVTEALAQAENLARAEGLYVRAVEPGSPGARAGVRPGDVLLLAGGAYLAGLDVLTRALAAAAVGTSVEVVLRRGGAPFTVALSSEPSPGGRLLTVIQPPVPGLLHLAADGAALWAYGPVPGGADRGIVAIQLPGGPLPPIAARAVASPVAERVIAADRERVYLGWAGSELYIDVYEVTSGGVGRLPVRGAESLSNRCRPRGLARVGGELWFACQRPEGPAVARIDLASGHARVEAMPPTYWGGLAFDGEAVLWLCCPQGDGRLSLARTELASGATRVFPLGERFSSVAADGRAVYLLGAAAIYQHKPWR